MTKTNTTQVFDEYPPTTAGRVPPLPDHAGSIPGYNHTELGGKQTLLKFLNNGTIQNTHPS